MEKLKAPLQFLEVRGPDGQEFTVELAQDQVTVGRLRDFNDIILGPDPQQLITRAHCAVEQISGAWWVTDNGSTNGTFVQQSHGIQHVKGRGSIGDGDIIRILGKLTEAGEPAYWELTFNDPLKTRRFDTAPKGEYLEYDWIQAKLFRMRGASRGEICGLRPQEHKLVRYMDNRNRSNGGVPVICMYEELITAIWADEDGHTEAEVNRLVWELRQKTETEPKEPQFLQTVRSLGYRLVTSTPVE